MTRFDTGEPEGAAELGYERALEALPFVSGRLERGELDERLQVLAGGEPGGPLER